MTKVICHLMVNNWAIVSCECERLLRCFYCCCLHKMVHICFDTFDTLLVGLWRQKTIKWRERSRKISTSISKVTQINSQQRTRKGAHIFAVFSLLTKEELINWFKLHSKYIVELIVFLCQTILLQIYCFWLHNFIRFLLNALTYWTKISE